MRFTQILNVSVSASWLVLAIVALRFLLKKAPKALLCALWALVAVRLLCPVLPESSLSLVPTAELVPETYLYMEPANDLSQQASLEIVENPVYPDSVEVKLDASVDRVQTLDVFWTLVWWTGMGVMAIYALYSYLSLRLRTRVSVKLRANIWLCDDIDTPFILGILRPRICLPSFLPEEQMGHVIAHEKAHLKRRDHWWKPIGFALLTVHWFNPVMWLAYILLCRDIELACDEKVIRDMDKSEVRRYSETLVACSVSGRRIIACPLAFGEVGVKERVKRMLNYQKQGFWVMAIALVLCAVLVVCFLTEPASYTTLGSLEDDWLASVLTDVDMLSFVSGDLCIIEAENARAVADELSNLAVSSNPVSQSRSEERDSTWKIVVDNGAVLCISEDFSEIWVNDGVKPGYSYRVKEPELLREIFSDYHPSAGLNAMGLAGNFVPYRCLYMNPLSSYYPFGGDSGCVYYAGESSFTISGRTGYVIASDPVEWNWRTLDWEAEPFRTLAESGTMFGTSSLYALMDEDALYQPLSQDDFLLLDGDGRLMIVEICELKELGRQIWSVYQLVTEESMGSAEWKFQPMLSSQYPGFRFEFDMEYTSVTATCLDGTLISFDEPSAEGYPSGTTLEIPAGCALYWAPSEDGEIVTDAHILFTVRNGETPVYNGSLYITGIRPTVEIGEGGRTFQSGTYAAAIIGTGLHLEQNDEASGAVITAIPVEEETVSLAGLADGNSVLTEEADAEKERLEEEIRQIEESLNAGTE